MDSPWSERENWLFLKVAIPYSAKFSRAVNFADFANSNSIAKIIFVKITIFDLLRPKLILTTNVACVVIQLMLRWLFLGLF